MTGHAPVFPAGTPVAQSDSAERLSGLVIGFILIGTLVFNFALCFANTNLFPVTKTHVVFSEAALLAMGAICAMDRAAGFVIVLVSYLSYAVFLMALQGSVDAKSTRDALIPIVFVFLGGKYRSCALGDKAVLVSSVIVLAVALFEFFYLDQYLRYFHILSYYIARGSIDETGTLQAGGHLFVSGMRFGERSLFPFLGQLRTSSVFLEPVSMGNFGVIAIIWIVFRSWGQPLRMLLRALPAFAILILADSRFGMLSSLIVVAAFALAPLVSRMVVLAAPFVVASALALYGMTNAYAVWSDDFLGRLLWSGQILNRLDVWHLLGVEGVTFSTNDSGYAYAFTHLGLLGAAALWALFVLSPVDHLNAWRLKVSAAAYIVVNLAVSNSLFSIKTAALFWFLAGTGTMARSRVAASPRIPV